MSKKLNVKGVQKPVFRLCVVLWVSVFGAVGLGKSLLFLHSICTRFVQRLHIFSHNLWTNFTDQNFSFTQIPQLPIIKTITTLFIYKIIKTAHGFMGMLTHNWAGRGVLIR